MKDKLPIEMKNELFGLYLYPAANEIREKQQDVTWTAQEIPVEDDKQDYLVNMDEHQRLLAETTLQTFVEIEQTVGDVWETFAHWFPHSEIEGACIEIARMEKAVHAFFYQKMSDVLNIDSEDIAKQQQAIKPIREKLHLLKEITTNLEQDKLLSLFTVAAIEQVLLFGNFAMLKSFKANGYNLIKKSLTGVDYVIQDEQLHGDFASYLHNQYLKEMKEAGMPVNLDEHKNKCLQVIQAIVAHEEGVVDYVFSATKTINSISPKELKAFIRSRANTTLQDMGFDSYYEEKDNPIAESFYQGINSIKVHDFFAANTTQYRRNWKFDNFSFFSKENDERIK